MPSYSFKWSTPDADDASIVVRNGAGTIVATGTTADVVAVTNEAFVTYTVDLLAGDTYTATATVLGRSRSTVGVLDTSAAALSATFAGVGKAISGNRLVSLGDSVTQAGDAEAGIGSGTATVASDSWPTHAGLASGQRIQRVRNAGNGGDTSAAMLARFDTDVTPFAPNIVSVLAGTNDIGGGTVTFTTWQNNIKAIVAKIRGIGALPVLITIPPRNDAQYHSKIVQWNNWLRRYAATEKLPMVDFYAVLVDSTNGFYLSALNGDLVHPNAAGYRALGQAFSTALAGWLPPAAPPVTQSSADPLNGAGAALGQFDGCFNGAVTSGRAGTWVVYGSLPGGATPSVTTDAAVIGKMQRITATATAAEAILYRAPSVGNPANNTLAVGNRILFTGIVTTSGIGAGIQINFNGASKSCKPLDIAVDVTRGRYYAEAVIPAGTTSIDHMLKAKAGTGYAEFGQVTMYDLTAQAVV